MFLKKILLSLLVVFFLKMSPQSTCANAPLLSSGSCLSNQGFPGSINMSGLCVGGSNPALYIKFVAGSCSEFTITSSANISTIGSQILTSACAGVTGTLECHDNVIANTQFSVNGVSTTGGNLLTPGVTYILRLWGPVPTGTTFNICYLANETFESSDECSGALTLGSLPMDFYNGGDCQFTGSYTNTSANDPPPANLCAGSLENTQWIKFSPQAGVTSFTIIGSNIQCIGGGCGFQFGILSGPCNGSTFEGCYGNKVCSGGQSVQGPTNQNANDGYSLTWNNATANFFQVTITRTGGLAFTGSEIFYLVMDGNADADCSYTLQGSGLVQLSLDLLNFESSVSDKSVKLNWTTINEENNDYFEVLRSENGYDFYKIGQVKSINNSTDKTNYEFVDSNTESNIYYYILKYVDIDGKYKYSKIISAIIDYKESKATYYNLNGVEVEFINSPAGIYIKKEGLNFTRVVKIQ